MTEAEHKQRMKEIQQRKLQRRHKQVIINRCILGVLAAVILLLIILGIRSCAASSAKKKAASATPVATESATPELTDNSGIDQTFFANSAFFGNSFIDGMASYNLVDGADYFGKVALSVDKAMTDALDNGTKPAVEELNNNKQYDKIFLMFGENECAWPNLETFYKKYEKLIDKIKSYQPNAKIYLLSVTPVSQKASDNSTDGTTNANIMKINEYIYSLASDDEYIYCDIFSAVADSNYALPANDATDGIHFGSDGYKKCLIAIQTNNKNGSSPRMTAPPQGASSSESGSGSTSGSSASSSGSSGTSANSSATKSSGSTSSGSSGTSATKSSGSSSSGSSGTSSGSSSTKSSGSSSSGSSGTSSNSSSTKSSGSGSSSSGSSATAAPAKNLGD